MEAALLPHARRVLEAIRALDEESPEHRPWITVVQVAERLGLHYNDLDEAMKWLAARGYFASYDAPLQQRGPIRFRLGS